MYKKSVYIFSILIIVSLNLFCQSYPWERPLKMAWSHDGITFTNSSIFQDSSGVPCVIRWKGDTLICAFQWFRQPKNTPSWDRVAVKFSYDNGLTWTSPTPIVVNGLPATYQRPFDPTLAIFGKDSIRIYYSSSAIIPKMGNDSIINTYSANSIDGIHYTFEPLARVDEPMNRVIDPAVVYFKNAWHYIAPIGSPQQGAYHYVSPNGINFSSVPVIPSDNMHNWTGNFMVNDPNELRFYGSGSTIWYNSSPNGGMWNGFVKTNVQGGDPSVVKVDSTNYLMVYVGNPYPSSAKDIANSEVKICLFPNPATNSISVLHNFQPFPFAYNILSTGGNIIEHGRSLNSKITLEKLLPGRYFLELQTNSNLTNRRILNFIKE